MTTLTSLRCILPRSGEKSLFGSEANDVHRPSP
jgi:hypothetical protein